MNSKFVVIAVGAGALIAVILLVMKMSSSPLSGGFSDAQKKQVAEIALDAIKNNPKAIGEALEQLIKEKRAEELKVAQAAVGENKASWSKETTSPVIGNPEGDVTIVEFFDYRCGYCKKMDETLNDLIKSDGKVRVVLKELPIFGGESIIMTQVALAAKAQDKYKEVHSALMQADPKVDEAGILAIAEKTGVNMDQLKKDMNSKEVLNEVKETMTLAQKLQLQGTPAVIIGEALYPGALPIDKLKEAVAAERTKK